MSTTKKSLVDTNIFLYPLLREDKLKAKQCRLLFDNAKLGNLKLWASSMTIVEIIWILDKHKWEWSEIKPTILSILNTKGVEVGGKMIVMTALNRCKKTADFVDQLLITEAESLGIKQGYSYDKNFANRVRFKRLEP